MRYSEPLANQLWVFFAFLGAGFLLGALYLAFAFLRALFQNGRGATAALDLLFCLSSFAVLFSVSLAYTSGIWRLPALAAAAAGFFAFQKTVFFVLRPWMQRAAAFLRRRLDALFVPVRAAADRIGAWLANCLAQQRSRREKKKQNKSKRRSAKAETNEKNSVKKRKKHAKALAKPVRIQYNDS